MKYDLHAPLTLRNITLPGRVVRASTELFCAQPGGFVHPYEYDVYRNLADKRLGMILTGTRQSVPECAVVGRAS